MRTPKIHAIEIENEKALHSICKISISLIGEINLRALKIQNKFVSSPIANRIKCVQWKNERRIIEYFD